MKVRFDPDTQTARTRQRRISVIVIGSLFIAIGVFFFLCALLEFPAFSLLSTGSARYEGFGFGSFMFAFIVFFIYIYFACAILFVTAGIGFISHGWWALRLSQIVLYAWSVAGSVIVVNALLLFTDAFNSFSSFKERIAPYEIVIFLSILVSVLIILPACLSVVLRQAIRRNIFDSTGTVSVLLSRFPLPVALLLVTYVLSFFGCSFSFFLESMFPFMGNIVTGFYGSVCNIAFAMILVVALFFTVRPFPAFRWICVILFSFLAVSSFITFSRYSLIDVCGLLGFPEKEMSMIGGMFVFKDFHLSLLLSAPHSVAVALLLVSNRYFHPTCAKCKGSNNDVLRTYERESEKTS